MLCLFLVQTDSACLSCIMGMVTPNFFGGDKKQREAFTLFDYFWRQKFQEYFHLNKDYMALSLARFGMMIYFNR